MPTTLLFTPHQRTLTLGVEAELQLIDSNSLQLVPRAREIMQGVADERLSKEMFQSTLELVTGVCKDVDHIGREMDEMMVAVRPVTQWMGIELAGTGTHPTADYHERLVTTGTRYAHLLDRNQWLIRRMAVYGLHVHLGMADGDTCIRFNNFFLHFVPHLIALSASSPFWRGVDTGLVAARPTAYEAHPTSGLPILVDTWAEFQALYAHLISTGSIRSMKDIWWDLRPSPRFGTLEIRICDGPATRMELTCIVAFIHLLAHWYADHEDAFGPDEDLRPSEWVLRENKWRAIRYGLDAHLIRAVRFAQEPIVTNFKRWFDRLEPYVDKLGYASYMEGLLTMLEKGNSAKRQRAVMAAYGNLDEVVRHNMRELAAGEPIWDAGQVHA